jgi:hypothetical protein
MPRRSSIADTAGGAQHTSTLVAAQLLEGWLATLVNTSAHDGSISWSPDRSQITATGRSASRLSSTRRSVGTASRSSSPTGARMVQPSRVDWSIRTAHSPWPFGSPRSQRSNSHQACPSTQGPNHRPATWDSPPVSQQPAGANARPARRAGPDRPYSMVSPGVGDEGGPSRRAESAPSSPVVIRFPPRGELAPSGELWPWFGGRVRG